MRRGMTGALSQLPPDGKAADGIDLKQMQSGVEEEGDRQMPSNAAEGPDGAQLDLYPTLLKVLGLGWL
uniref:Uncharacterized protein n=1 Tax=Sphaerodactylus townsendi TaxID=933632 RepID=A0ACB8F4V5_9SAUR